MTKPLRRMLAGAIQTDRPVLVNPTDDEIWQAAEKLRAEGRLICTTCRKPIREAEFRSRRISFGSYLQVITHVHVHCEPAD